MSEVLLFLASVIADVWDLYFECMPNDYIGYVLLLFTCSLVVARIVRPVIARSSDRFFGSKQKGGD